MFQLKDLILISKGSKMYLDRLTKVFYNNSEHQGVKNFILVTRCLHEIGLHNVDVDKL